MFKAKVSPILTRYCKTIGTAHPLSLSYELVALYHSLSLRGFNAAINSVHGRKALKRSSSKKLSQIVSATRVKSSEWRHVRCYTSSVRIPSSNLRVQRLDGQHQIPFPENYQKKLDFPLRVFILFQKKERNIAKSFWVLFCKRNIAGIST